MEKLFQIATTISTPLALGGLFAVIFFFIIKQMLAKDVFPPLTKSSAFNILKTIVDRLFVLALIAMLLGFAGYIIPILLPAIFSQKSFPQASSNDPPKFRVRYFDVAGYGIDFLMKGMVDEKMEKYLSGQPFIVPNEVFNEMKFLMKKFSIYTDVPHLIDKEHNYLKNKIKGNFFGSIDFNSEIEADQYMLSSFTSWKDWIFCWTGSRYDKKKYINEIKTGKINASYFTFFKVADKLLAENFYDNNKSMELYKFLTKKFQPKDFSIIRLWYELCPSGVWMIGLIGRTPVLKVAVIENTTKSQIEIGDFFLKKDSSDQLRYRSEIHRDTKENEKKLLFPLKILSAGEKILIPIELYFKYDIEYKNYIKELVDRKNIPSELKTMKHAEYVPIIEDSYRDFIPRINRISWENLSRLIDHKNMIDIHNFERSLDHEFVYGTSFSIEKITVDGKVYPFRKNDEKSFVLYYSSEVGSCPYAYTYSPEIKQWISEGHILYGKSSKRKEGWDSIKLKRFTGKVIIKENDPEVSFIDLLRIRVERPDGKEQFFLPKQDILRSEDQQYLTMKQGEQTEVEFDEFQENSGDVFYLESKGYYEVRDH